MSGKGRNVELRAAFFVRSDGVAIPRAKRRLPHDSPLRHEVFRRDGGRCRYCGRRVVRGLGSARRLGYDDPRWGVRAEIDHALPISRGGQNDLGNLVLACFDCNRGKHAAERAR